jgi:hypothetical protein
MSNETRALLIGFGLLLTTPAVATMVAEE